jgi:hypothetical protein
MELIDRWFTCFLKSLQIRKFVFLLLLLLCGCSSREKERERNEVTGEISHVNTTTERERGERKKDMAH